MHGCLTVKKTSNQLYHLIEPHLTDFPCKLNELFLHEGNIGFEQDMILFSWVKNM